MSTDTIEKALDSQFAVKAARLRKIEAAKPDLGPYNANTCVTNCDALGIPVPDSLRVLAEKHRVDARKAALDKARTEFARAQAELAKLEEEGR